MEIIVILLNAKCWDNHCSIDRLMITPAKAENGVQIIEKIVNPDNGHDFPTDFTCFSEV